MSIYEKLDKPEKRIRADLEDKVIDIIFSITNNAVFHGGTCVWRCFGGERFSKDIDIYIKNKKVVKKIIDYLNYNGYRTKLSIPSFSKNNIDFYFYKVKGILDLQIAVLDVHGGFNDYENLNGSKININTLNPENIILEKIDAYNDRREARDLYDIWILTRYYRLTEKSWSDLDTFIYSIKPCVNYGDLLANVYGKCPSCEEMVNDIKGAVNDIK